MFSPKPQCLILDLSAAPHNSSTLCSGPNIWIVNNNPVGENYLFMTLQMGQNDKSRWQVWRGTAVEQRAGSFLPTAPAAQILYGAACAATAALAAMWTWIFKNVWVQLLFWPAANFSYEMQLKERKLWCSTVYDSTKLHWIQGTKKWHFFSSWVFFLDQI